MSKGVLLATAAVVAVAGVALTAWYRGRSKASRYEEFDEEESKKAVSTNHEPQEHQKEEKKERESEKKEVMMPAVSPRTFKKVLDEAGDRQRAEDEADEFQMLSPRLEAFLTAEPKSAAKAVAVGKRGPKAAAAKAKVPVVKKIETPKKKNFLEDDDDDGDEMTDAEIKAILARGKKMNAAEEKAAPFPIVSPRLEKFLEDK